MDSTLGVVAHRGGLLVRRPELTVGMVQAVSRPSGLSLEVIARRPPGLRSRGGETTGFAPRRLLPAFDEGQDLRLGWLDPSRRVHWEYSTSTSSWSGHAYTGTDSLGWRSTYVLPPMFDRLSFVLAWPEIGFEETTITIPLPDQATVERETTSVWQAPLNASPVTEPLIDHHTDHQERVPIEEGTVVAAPQVLHRGTHAVVALTRVTAVGSALSLELLGEATGPVGGELASHDFPPPGPSLAVANGNDAYWLPVHEGTSSGGDRSFTTVQEFTTQRPDGDTLDLVVAWPGADLPNVRVRVLWWP